MNVYQFDSKELDEAFLQRLPVRCKASLPKALVAKIHKGDRIVVQLTNRSKYMGVISNIDLHFTNIGAEGFIEITRH